MKKVYLTLLMLILLCLVFAQKQEKLPYCFDASLGVNKEVSGNSKQFCSRLGFSHQVNGPYFVALHASLWANKITVAGIVDMGKAVDLQGGYTFETEYTNICPAVGIGYTDVKDKYALALPLSLNILVLSTDHFGLQLTGNFNLNTIKSYYGIYAGLVFGRLR